MYSRCIPVRASGNHRIRSRYNTHGANTNVSSHKKVAGIEIQSTLQDTSRIGSLILGTLAARRTLSSFAQRRAPCPLLLPVDRCRRLRSFHLCYHSEANARASAVWTESPTKNQDRHEFGPKTHKHSVATANAPGTYLPQPMYSSTVLTVLVTVVHTSSMSIGPHVSVLPHYPSTQGTKKVTTHSLVL